MARKTISYLILLLIILNGCSKAIESSKAFWGSSVSSLQQIRRHALTKLYDCQYDSCFDSVIKILEEQGARIFIKDKPQRIIVAMEIKHCVTTTEVGIFFVEEPPDRIKIEVASLSPKAKRIASELIFSGLDVLYNNNNAPEASQEINKEESEEVEGE